MVPDAFRRINLQNFKHVVVDNRTSIREIASDIQRGLMDLTQVSQLVLLVGRADILSGYNVQWIAEITTETSC